MSFGGVIGGADEKSLQQTSPSSDWRLSLNGEVESDVVIACKYGVVWLMQGAKVTVLLSAVFSHRIPEGGRNR